MLAGVCSGLGRRVGIDPWPARLLFVLLVLALHGSLILIYVLLWILMPVGEATVGGTTSGSSPTYPVA